VDFRKKDFDTKVGDEDYVPQEAHMWGNEEKQ